MQLHRSKASDHQPFQFPTPMYYIVKLLDQLPTVAKWIHQAENWQVQQHMSKGSKERIAAEPISKPIFISGLARAGTTITLEMLSHHPAVASHRYLHMVVPYMPHWVQRIADYVPIMTTPTERLHQDRLAVTKNSREAVEEIFWQHFFTDPATGRDPHAEAHSNVLTHQTTHPEFVRFYRSHINKLLFNQHATRYLAKNNYNVARMDYLRKLFPDAKFIILIRHPFNHIASLIKQDLIFQEMERRDPRLLDWTKIIGHREFGSAKVCMNLNNQQAVERIRRCWTRKRTYVEGWALYWAEVYRFVQQQLKTNPRIRKAVQIIRYEDLCDHSHTTIDTILHHAELDPTPFTPIKRKYTRQLQKPLYYHLNYTDSERQAIKEHTHTIAAEFGYEGE